MTATNAQNRASSWVDAFRAGWSAPESAESLIECFRPYLAENARFLQPRLPDIIGPDALREEFIRPLLTLVPDARGEVTNWASRGDTLYVDIVLRGTLGGRPVTLCSCDRITLNGEGICTVRVANADPLDLVFSILTRPRSWPTVLKLAATRRRGHRALSRPGTQGEKA